MAIRHITWPQALGGAFIGSTVLGPAISRLGDLDTFCAAASLSGDWCGSGPLIGAIFSKEVWLPLSILVGVALILWGERKRYTAQLGEQADKVTEIESGARGVRGEFDEFRPYLDEVRGNISIITETARNLDTRLQDFRKNMVHTCEEKMGFALNKTNEVKSSVESLEKSMSELEQRFDTLLKAMSEGEAPSAGKKPSTPPASSQNGDGDCGETQTPPDTSEDASG